MTEDTVWIVDDDAQETEMLAAALVNHVPSVVVQRYDSVAAARLAVNALRGRDPFPVVVFADLDTGEEQNDGAHLLNFIHKRAISVGSGMWSVLISKHPALSERVEDSAVPGLMHFRKTKDGWADDCARTVAQLFGHDPTFDNDHDHLCPPLRIGGELEGTRPAIKDRIFVYSSGTVQSHQAAVLFSACPFVRVPEQFQVPEPVFRYRGSLMVVHDPASKLWLAQQLVRWRVLCSVKNPRYSTYHMAGASCRANGTLDERAFQAFGESVVMAENPGKCIDQPRYSIRYGSFDNVTNDARKTPELKRLLQFLFGVDDCWPRLRRLPSSSTLKSFVRLPVPVPPELAGRAPDGFFLRAHFVLDESNLTALNLWVKWIRSSSGALANAARQG